ncbi:MAG: hypothetical protein HYZ15_04065 [Sphingobacteriales bacterium]|nr:hypothetical protein [Sphingobacteriales bacterium]
MGIQKDVYNRRLGELEGLLKKSQSQTSRTLLEEAIQLTRHAFVECERISKLANEKIVFYDNAKKNFDEALKQMDRGIEKINAAATIELLSQDTKDKIIAAGQAMARDVKHQYEIRATPNRQLRAAIDQCNTDLRRTLLELIYKPNSSAFIIDAVVSIFTKIVTGLIPYSDKAEMILETSITNRKKQYLSRGDKLLVYLEDYISVLKAWLLLNEQFEKEVLS